MRRIKFYESTTRGITATILCDSFLWWQGPQWLVEPQNWPKNCAQVLEPEPAIIAAVASDSILVLHWDRYGEFAQIIRVMAWVLR